MKIYLVNETYVYDGQSIIKAFTKQESARKYLADNYGHLSYKHFKNTEDFVFADSDLTYDIDEIYVEED